MFGFILAASLVFGLIMGLRASYEEARVGETVAHCRLAGLIMGFVAWAFAFVGLLVCWGAGALYWWVAFGMTR